MELKIEQVAIPEKIAFNYEELKQELSDKVKMYETLVYSDEQIKEAKADRADLNRLKKALNDERIRREKEYMQPFNNFKIQVNEIISIIDKPVSMIDRQVKEYEEKQKREKKEKIAGYFFTAGSPDWLTLPMIWDEKWLNASVSMKSIQEQIDTKIENISSDLATLSNLPEFAFEAIETYKSTLDLNKSIAEGHRLSEMQKRKAEQERLRKEQEERARRAMPQATTEPFVGTAGIPDGITEEEIAQSVEDYREAANVGGVHMQEPTKQWISFSALVDVDDARAIRNLFESRNIEFKRI